MYRNFDIPQNAIRQSNEFIDLGKKESALEILFEALKARKARSWRAPIEEAMNNYLSLCLILMNSQRFRDGVMQYRLICQNTNVSSFESTLSKFFGMTLEAVEKAWNQSREKVLAEDLDQLETPETILLKSISETTQQDRTDRVMLSPILKFAWESFRCILDVSKNNKNFEKFYADMARKSFKFLMKYERKTEFRKLCDVTRIHLHLITRYPPNSLSISFSDVASVEILLSVRLDQLETAISMELWVEAFRTMEDIHYIMRQNRKTLHPRILAIFYQKIALVFAKTNAPLFHAIALHKLFILIKEQKKGIKPEEMIKISSRALGAAISVPFTCDRDSFESLLFRYTDNLYNISQLSTVLGINYIPQKSTLIDDILKTSVLEYACPQLVNIFYALNGAKRHPFLCSYIEEQLKAVPESLNEVISAYVEPIKKLAFCLFLRKISDFFQNISIRRLVKLSCYYSYDVVLSVLLECGRNGFLSSTIDGETETVYFLHDSFEHRKGEPTKVAQSLSYLLSNIQDIDQIISFNERQKRVINLIKAYHEGNLLVAESSRYKKVQEDIIKHSEQISRETEQANKENMEKMEEERTRMEELENIRLEEERKKRDEERELRDLKEKEFLQTCEQVNELINSEIAKRIFKDITIEELQRNPTKYINAHNEVRDKEIANHARKMKETDKYVDVFLHIMRKEEKQRFSAYKQQQQVKRQESWQNMEQKFIETITQNKKLQAEFKQKLISAQDDIKDFSKASEKIAIDAHAALVKEYEDLIEKERQNQRIKCKAERIHRRKLEKVEKLKKLYEVINPPKREFTKKAKTNIDFNTTNQPAAESTKPTPFTPSTRKPVSGTAGYFNSSNTSSTPQQNRKPDGSKRTNYF